jgi:hypothetical protein
MISGIKYFNWPNPSSRTMALGSTRPVTEMSTRNFPGWLNGGRHLRSDCLDKMWDPRRLTTLLSFTVWDRDSLTLNIKYIANISTSIEIWTGFLMNNVVFWDVTPCILVDVYRRRETSTRLHVATCLKILTFIAIVPGNSNLTLPYQFK